MHPVLARLMGLLGLVSLGEGLFILFRVVPHESPLLGLGLAALGALLLYFAPLPRIDRVPRWPLAIGGLALAIGVVAWNATTGASWVAPKIALVALGLALAIAAPLARDRPRVAHAIAWGLPLAGAPLAVWAMQAFAATSIAGMTPMEHFIERALLPPMATALAWMGYHPYVDGQHITFDTQQGGTMRLLVGVACSGLQAMGLFGGILVVYVLAEKPRFWRGAAWCAIGLLGVYVVNVIRLISLALVGSAHGSAALQWAHANLGWMFFAGWAGLFAWLAMGTKVERPARPRVTRGPQNP